MNIVYVGLYSNTTQLFDDVDYNMCIIINDEITSKYLLKSAIAFLTMNKLQNPFESSKYSYNIGKIKPYIWNSCVSESSHCVRGTCRFQLPSVPIKATVLSKNSSRFGIVLNL